MPAVQDADVTGVVGNLGEQSRREVLRLVVGGDTGAVAGDGGLEPADQCPEVRLVVGVLTEAVDHRGGRSDGGQALAPHVADEQTDAVRRVRGLVEVAADPCLLLGRQVDRLDLDAVDPVRQRPQQHLLGRVRDEPDLEQRLLPLKPQMARVRGRRGDRTDRGGRVRRSQVGVEKAEADHDQQAEHPQQDGREHGPQSGGEGGCRGQQTAEGDLPRRGGREGGDDERDDHWRQQHGVPLASLRTMTAPGPS